MRRNRIVLSLAAAAASVVGLGACATREAGAAGQGDARDALTASLSGVQAGNYTLRSGGRSWAVHLPGSALVDRDLVSLTKVGSEVYLKYRLGGGRYEDLRRMYEGGAERAAAQGMAKAAIDKELQRYRAALTELDGTRWVRADEKKLRAAIEDESISLLDGLSTGPVPGAPDITGISPLLTAVTTATRNGSTVTGTLDATTIKDGGLNFAYETYGPRAKTLPYRATLDDQGRLTAFTVDLPGELEAPASVAPEALPSDAPTRAAREPISYTLTDYGTTPAPVAPAGAGDLSPLAYEMIANDND